MLVRIRVSTYSPPPRTGTAENGEVRFRPLLLHARPPFRGPVLSLLVHGALIAAGWAAGRWIVETGSPWFDPGSSITWLRPDSPDGRAPGILFLPFPQSGTGHHGTNQPSGSVPKIGLSRLAKVFERAREMMAPPPVLRVTSGESLAVPEPEIVGLAGRPGKAEVMPPEAPEARHVSENLNSAGGRSLGTPASPAVREPDWGKEIRVAHPADGQFDVVLVQSAPDLFLRPLKGLPVYLVYLDVGTRKPWILHFCAKESEVEITEHVVRIGAIVPVAAPNPRVTVIPASLAGGTAGRPLAISGVIDEDGRLKQLDASGEKDRGILKRLMAAFEGWLFRPAKRDGTPVAVQVMLVVPAGDQKQ